MTFIKGSSIRFLVSRSGSRSSVLFRFASSGVGNKQGSVVLEKKLFDLSFLGFVDEFLIVCDDSLADGLSDGVDLCDITSTSDGDSDVKVLEFLKA
jgi:hypothetical protein